MKCSYCQLEIGKLEGTMFVANTGTRYYFCSAKCEKHWGRKRKLQYTKKEKKAAA